MKAIDLFRYYYLGFDEDYEYGMHNIGQAAKAFGVDVPTLKARLSELGLLPETVKRVRYNVASAHADAYALDLEGASIGEREALVERVWAEFQAARAEGLSDEIIDHLNVDDLPAALEKLGVRVEE